MTAPVAEAAPSRTIAPDDPTVKRTQATRNRSWGLIITPAVLLILAVLLYFYYQSLDLREDNNFAAWSSLQGSKLRNEITEMIVIALWSTLFVISIAVPLGVLLTRENGRRFAPAVLAVANAGQAVPAYGLLILFLSLTGQGLKTVVISLVFYALLPVLRNTMVGLGQVDRATIEAGRGMGMTSLQALTRIELPLAVPIILAGIRTALVINIGVATLAFLVGGGGLGITLSTGLKLQQDPVVFIASAMVALLALTVDWIAAMIERLLRPKGI